MSIEASELAELEVNIDHVRGEVQHTKEWCVEVMEIEQQSSSTCRAPQMSMLKDIPEYEDERLFDENWIKFIKAIKVTTFSVEWFTKSRRPWLVFFPNEDFPDHSKFACRFCQKYAASKALQHQHIPEMSSLQGSVDKCEVLDYGTDNIINLANYFGIEDHVMILQHWRALLMELANRYDETCRMKSVGNSVKFWSHFLSDKNLPWTQELR